MKYIIIGLGKYGKVLAEELSALGHEVIGVDNNENNINEVKDKIAVTYLMDASQEVSFSVLPLSTVDVVIVAIGENLDASIRVISMLKKRKVKHIFARAIDSTHKEILQAFDVEKILAPEEDSAFNLVRFMDFGYATESVQIDDEYYIMKFDIPNNFAGLYVSDLKLDKEFNIKILSLLKCNMDKNASGLQYKKYNMISLELINDSKLYIGDKLICLGKQSDFRKLWKAL